MHGECSEVHACPFTVLDTRKEHYTQEYFIKISIFNMNKNYLAPKFEWQKHEFRFI